jgi:hypothetical protein
MKKIVLASGLIAGPISLIGFALIVNNIVSSEYGMLVGYASMLIAFSLIFVAIINYRDKQNGGVITFGKAFLIGLYITLIGSTVYVVIWLISYYFFIPDYLDKYMANYLAELKTSGASPAKINAETAEMAGYMEMYKNPFFNAMMTYMEILPVGLIVSLISAAILRRKPKFA